MHEKGCPACGSSTVIYPENFDLNSPVVCRQCGTSLGTWRTFEQRARAAEENGAESPPSSKRKAASELRSTPRSRCLLRGVIVYNGRSSTIDCTVRDLSETGAKLIVSGAVSLPEVFGFEIPTAKTHRRAQIVWHKGDRCGVRFIG
jgi:hypothetical protein